MSEFSTRKMFTGFLARKARSSYFDMQRTTKKKNRFVAWMWLTVLLLQWLIHLTQRCSISWLAVLAQIVVVIRMRFYFSKGRRKSSHRLNFILALRHFVYMFHLNEWTKNTITCFCIQQLGPIWSKEKIAHHAITHCVCVFHFFHRLSLFVLNRTLKRRFIHYAMPFSFATMI